MNFIGHETEQKLRGGYYTPSDLAEFLINWINPKAGDRLLEPSCGDGIFLEALKGKGVDITAFEVSEEEAAKSQARGLKQCVVHTRDFLEWALSADDSQYDAIMGNPPFIRYQYLPSSFQENAEKVFHQLSCKFTKHTNAWVPFILSSINLLKPGGRLAMVVPSEIIHVMHAQSLRTYLGEKCSRIVLIDPKELWFEGTLQGAVLLLAQKKSHPREHGEGLAIRPVVDREFLIEDPEDVFRQPRAINGKTVQGKWTRALVSPRALHVLDEIEERADFFRFKDIAKVDVGIVTGANKFFLINDSEVIRHDLNRWAHPMFGRSDHCPGIIYDEDQHIRNANEGKPTNFLWFQDVDVEENPGAKDYIEAGERENLHTRYKCRIRSPWYKVPSVYSTKIGMLKRSHDTPRLILNRLGAYTTDTAYRIRSFHGGAENLVYSYVNSLTALSAELEGRYYGGGVLELVPSEIEKLLLPDPCSVTPNIDKLDKMIREDRIENTLEAQSSSVLKNLTNSQRVELLSAWASLRNRRQRLPA